MKLEITDEERNELARLVEQALSDMRIETRRTRNPEWHDQLRSEEGLLASLLKRLQAEST
jgi:ribosome recycling factor